MERGSGRDRAASSGRPGDRTFAPTRLAAARPPIGRWLTVGLIGLVLILLKPWVGPESDTVQPGGPVVGRATAPPSPVLPSPTLAPNAADPAVTLFCLDPGSWRVATVERWRDQTIRVWRAIDPIAGAAGPADGRIPTFPIVSEGVTELGWCAPVTGPDRPAGLTSVDVWQRTTDGPVAIDLHRSRPVEVASSFGALYRPPGAGIPLVWAAGSYVFRVGEAGRDGRWFAVELELRPSTGRRP